jgi:hypothetical protein
MCWCYALVVVRSQDGSTMSMDDQEAMQRRKRKRINVSHTLCRH